MFNKIRDSKRVYNVDPKKIFKENYIPINKNLYKKYSITENSIPFKFGIFKEKPKFIKKNSIRENFIFGPKNLIKANDFTIKIKSSQNNRNITKGNISIGEKRDKREKSEKKENYNTMNFNKKNNIDWYRKWIFLKFYIRTKISQKSKSNKSLNMV